MPSERIESQQRLQVRCQIWLITQNVFSLSLQVMHAELRVLAAAKIQELSNESGSTKVVAMPTDEEIIDGEVFTARALAAGEMPAPNYTTCPLL